MTRSCTVATLAIGILLAAGSRSAVGQTFTLSQGVVSNLGVTVIKRQPELMRMRLELTATGKDLPDALAKLKSRRETALKDCAGLGAAAETLAVGSPRIGPGAAQRQRMVPSYAPTIRAGGRGAKKPEAAPPVNVSAWLTAEWPLKGEGAEELLIASQSLREKITAQLVKSAPKADLSPEQEEMQEEAAPQMMNDGSGAKPGEPVFLFVAKVSKEEYVKAAAKAFATAKAHAQRLAEAAGTSLGELRNVEGNDRQTAMAMSYPRQYYNGMPQDDDSPEQESSTEEATGANPAEVRMSVMIVASFALGK
jgi:hypothetical protein